MGKRLLFIFFFASLTGSVWAQNRASFSAYQKGIREYLDPAGSPKKAEKHFLRAVKLDPVYPAP